MVLYFIALLLEKKAFYQFNNISWLSGIFLQTFWQSNSGSRFSYHLHLPSSFRGLPGWLSSKESACSAGDTGLIHGLGRSPGEGHGNLLQYSCRESRAQRNMAGWSPQSCKELDLIEATEHTHTLLSNRSLHLPSLSPVILHFQVSCNNTVMLIRLACFNHYISVAYFLLIRASKMSC